MSDYQVRLIRDVSNEHIDPEGIFHGAVEILSIVAQKMQSVSAVLDEIEKDDEYSGYKILSIVLIDSRNQELLGDEYLNGGNE